MSVSIISTIHKLACPVHAVDPDHRRRCSFCSCSDLVLLAQTKDWFKIHGVLQQDVVVYTRKQPWKSAWIRMSVLLPNCYYDCTIRTVGMVPGRSGTSTLHYYTIAPSLRRWRELASANPPLQPTTAPLSNTQGPSGTSQRRLLLLPAWHTSHLSTVTSRGNKTKTYRTLRGRKLPPPAVHSLFPKVVLPCCNGNVLACTVLVELLVIAAS